MRRSFRTRQRLRWTTVRPFSHALRTARLSWQTAPLRVLLIVVSSTTTADVAIAAAAAGRRQVEHNSILQLHCDGRAKHWIAAAAAGRMVTDCGRRFDRVRASTRRQCTHAFTGARTHVDDGCRVYGGRALTKYYISWAMITVTWCYAVIICVYVHIRVYFYTLTVATRKTRPPSGLLPGARSPQIRWIKEARLSFTATILTHHLLNQTVCPLISLRFPLRKILKHW